MHSLTPNDFFFLNKISHRTTTQTTNTKMTSPLSKIEESVSNLSMFKDFVKRMQEGADRINAGSKTTSSPGKVIEDMESLNLSLTRDRDTMIVPQNNKDVPKSITNTFTTERAQQILRLELAKLNETKTRFEHILNEFREEKRRYSRIHEKQSEKMSILQSSIRVSTEETKKKMYDIQKNTDSRLSELESKLKKEIELRKEFETKYNKLLLKLENQNNEFEDVMQKNYETLAKRVKSDSKLFREETEKKRRMETMIMSMVEDLCTKMSQGLRREQKSRIDMEEKLMQVLKRVCSEVETHLDQP